MPGPISRWSVLQWKKHELLGPTTRREPRASDRDPRLGLPSTIFETRSRESRVAIFADAKPPVYELDSKGGDFDADGGTNLFLSARTGRRLATFDRPVTYAVTLQLSRASVGAPNARALQNGSVVAQVFSGFVLQFRASSGMRPTTLFLQIEHADSRGRQPDYRSCRLRRDGSAVAIYAGVLPEDRDLRFAPGREPLRFRYDLNRYLCHALEVPFSCGNAVWTPPLAARDGAKWRMREMYVGLETQDTRLDPHTKEPGAKAGDIEAAVEVSGLTVTREPAEPAPAGHAERSVCH